MPKHSRSLALCLAIGLGALAPVPALAYPGSGSIRTGETYVVRPGDTLWGIAAHFLRNPWAWPRIWGHNPQIRNPNLIYPGDRIVLTLSASGQPNLHVHVVEIRPGMGVQPIPSYHTGIIMPFLGSPGVTPSRKAYDALPHLAAAPEHRLAYAAGNEVYASGIGRTPRGTRFSIVRLGSVLKRPGSPRGLGYTLEQLGTAELVHGGPHPMLRILASRREIHLGDRLEPLPEATVPHFFPDAPAHAVSGQIIARMSSYPEMMTGQVVVVDQGKNAGLAPGNVLEIFSHPRPALDPATGKPYDIPPQKTGLLMVFRVFPRVSYGVITAATRGIVVGDAVRNPAGHDAHFKDTTAP